MKQAKWLVFFIALGILAVGCKKEEPVAETKPVEQPKPVTLPPAEVKPEAAAQPALASTPAPAAAPAPHSTYDRALLRPSGLKAQAPDKYQVKFLTTRGEFTVAVTRSWAPIGADRFYNLIKHHFYDNASFFRVVPGFVVQFGLSAYPPVSAAWTNAKLKDDPVTQSNKRGYLTYATGGANTRTTQIFINMKDNSGLDRMGFSPFGVVDGKGINVVEMLYEGYGDGPPSGSGPDQGFIESQGKPYLDKNYPKLDSIKTATLLP